jgi:LPXTG-site transpeptidase (sortase) family protein
VPYFKPTKYIKEEPKDPIYNHVNKRFLMQSRILPSLLPTIALLLLITQVAAPLVFFTTQDEISKPASSSALGLATGFSKFEFNELQNTMSENKVLGRRTDRENPKYFTISIPALDINSALVEINEPTLNPDKALGHYVNSALPGEVGNAFIYGHSVLPIFYNPNNYKTIFSTLHHLESGDLIYVEYKNTRYTYKVEGKRILKPDGVDPLAEIKPRFLNESTMILMTCSPPGTKINRLLVDTILIEEN